MKKLKPLLFAFIILFFANCEKEEVSAKTESNVSSGITSSRISFSELNNEIKTPRIKTILQGELFYTFNNDSFLRTSQTEPTFIKIQKDDLTTYSLFLNSYSQQRPYFLKLIITKNINESEKIGFLKYIPITPITTLDIAYFSGEVQILDLNFEVTATSEYVNGIKQNNQNKIENIARGRCRDVIDIVEVKCSHSGEHGVGESCAPGYTNDAHFEIYITTTCNDPSVPVQIIEDTGNTSNGTGGVYPASIFLNPFLNTLTQDELVVYYSNPAIQIYLVNNLVIVPTPNYNPQLGGDPTIVIIEPEAEEFIEQLIENSVETGLTFDVELSKKSPANIDFSEIDTTTPEGQKLDCIYKKLTNSPEFKRLFEGTFGGTQDKINVKFQMQPNLLSANGLPSDGNCSPTEVINGNYYTVITINSDILSGNLEKANILIAKTIIHEYLHAYLNLKYLDANQGTSLSFLSNLQLEELMYYYFTPATEHNFMFNQMIPVFQNILSEIVNDLLSAQNINDLNNSMITDTNGTVIENFNFMNFYKHIAFDGLHNTQSYMNDIESNPIETRKHIQYNNYAKNSSEDCQ